MLRRLADYFWPTIAVIAVSVSLAPHIGQAIGSQRPVSSAELQVLRDHVMARDRILRDSVLATHELDLALGWIYRENGVDRTKFDIDLTTGEFIPYVKGRTPDIPPTFIK